MTYRSRYGTNLQAHAVIDLVLTDDSNPRSVAFQIDAAADHLGYLPQQKTSPFVSGEQQVVSRMLADFRQLDLFVLCAVDETGRRTALDAQLQSWLQVMPGASNALASHYFSHTGASRQLSALRIEIKP